MRYLFFIFLLSFLDLQGQEKEEFKQDSLIKKYDFIVIQNDSATINLNPVFLLKRLKFKNRREALYYYWYRKKVLKTYPYATMAAEKLTDLNRDLLRIKRKHKRKKYIKKMQKYMQGEFTDQLKKLTRTEGRILIKLVYRQTGISVFNLIKDYRSGWKAFWYQTVARLFKLSLKKEYHPEISGKDFIIEDTITKSFFKR